MNTRNSPRARARAGRRPARRRTSYATAGVDSAREESGLKALVRLLHDTLATRPAGLGHVKLPFGFFANVVEVGDIGIAISTDGVGSKLLVAELLHKYDTIGIDCVAMNVNDVLCVGATPLAMLDYVAVEMPHDDLMGPLVQGLHHGAELAKITIPGGEIAQVREMIRGLRPGYAFDLVGTCV